MCLVFILDVSLLFTENGFLTLSGLFILHRNKNTETGTDGLNDAAVVVESKRVYLVVK